MDITSVVYGSANIATPPRTNIYVDETAELEKSKPQPISEPRPPQEKKSSVVQTVSLTKNKHESYDLSGSVFLICSDGKTLDLPIPSDSPSDPLNWNSWKTTAAMFALGWYAVTVFIASQSMALILVGILEDFAGQDWSPWNGETMVTAPPLFVGIGAFLWIPLSLALGRRPTFLIAALVNLVATIGAAYARTFHQLLAFHCMLSLAGGFALSLGFLMIIDVTFIDKRPKAIAGLGSVIGFFGSSGLSFVPALSDDGTNFRLFYRRWIVMAATSLLFAYLFYGETYFKRPTVAFDGMMIMQSATEKLTIYEDLEADSDLYKDLPGYYFDDEKRSIFRRLGLSRAPSTSFKAMGRCYLQIFFCTINPLIFGVLIASASNFAGMIYIAATYNKVLSAPPYMLSQSLITLINVSSGVGSLLSFPIVSILMSKILTWLSKRNRGVREAEHYLVGYVIPVLAGGFGTLLYGFAVQNRWDVVWFYVAYGLHGLSFASIAIVNSLWVTEAFPRWAAPAQAVVSGGYPLITFAMSFVLVPWINSDGFRRVGIELTALQFAGGLVALPMAFWGKSLRQKIHGRWANERSGALRPV